VGYPEQREKTPSLKDRGTKFAVFGKPKCSLQIIFNLRQRAACEFLEIWIGAVLDLVLEECSISPLMIDLAVYIVAVECGAMFGLERGNHRIVGGVQQGVGWHGSALVLQVALRSSMTGMWVTTIRRA
jgi:hypothetical protein